MLHDSIKAGDRLEISQVSDTGARKVYISVVEEITDAQLTAHMPIEYGKLVRLDQSAVYSVLFFTDKGMLQFSAAIAEYLKTDGFSLMKLDLVSEGERMQRRSFFRLNCVMPFKFAEIKNGTEENPGEYPYEGVIKDIGGGGVRFVTNNEISESASLGCALVIENEAIVSQGKVLHKQHFPKSVYAYQYRVQFLGMNHYDQERIVQYVYNEQRKIVKRAR